MTAILDQLDQLRAIWIALKSSIYAALLLVQLTICVDRRRSTHIDSSGSIMVPDESVKVDAVFVCQSASTLPCIWSNIVLFLDQMQVVWIDRNRFVWIDPHLMLHMAPYAALEPISPIAARAANDGDIGPIGPIVIGPINCFRNFFY